MGLNVEQTLQQGIAAHKAGNLQEAERAYRAILQSQPQHPDANHNLGLIAISANQIEAALPLFKTALNVNPNLEQYWVSYIDALVKNKQPKDAKKAIKTAKKKGIDAKKLQAVFAQSKRIVDTKAPSQAQLDSLLGLYQNHRYADAEKLATGMSQEFPSHNFSWKILGGIRKKTGRLPEAVDADRVAVALSPQDAEAHYNLGNSLAELDRLGEAEESYSRAIALKPGFAEAKFNLGNTQRERGKHDEAESNYTQAIALKPDFVQAHHNLGSTLQQLGRLDEAEASYNKAIALEPDYAAARNSLLFLNASMRFDASRYLLEAKGFADKVAEQTSSPFENWLCNKSAKNLKVGFVSGDFEEHPVGYFLEGLLVQLQSFAIELFAYPTNSPVGGLTDRLKDLFHSWTPLSGKSNRDAAQTIYRDGLHILIDLSGHTQKNRLAIFGWKPAPIQVTWLGYFASTGLPQIDFILGDPFVTPISEAHHFTEKIWQLPESYLCFTPPSATLAVGPLPALRNGFLTFGCFNDLSRMTDEVVSIRARILHAVPNSKLFLKDKRLEHQLGRDQVLSRFESFGISADSLLLEGRSSRGEYLSSYNRVDIALSPFPYGGGTTSVEGLWMGVPVITKKGSYYLSHLGESIAHNTNLSNWIAIDNEDYVAKAIEFSSDLNALETLRQNLRQELLKTPLYDLPRFANNFAKALLEMRELIDH